LRGRIVLLKREGPVDPAAPVAPRPFTIDVLGGTTQGNVKASNASGTFRYSHKIYRNDIDLKLRGEYRLDDGSRYHVFEASGNYEYLLNGRWSAFAYTSIGRDTKQQIAFTSSELGGVSYDFFSRLSATRLQLNAGVGHRNLVALDVPEEDKADPANFKAFSNKAILSYRLKFEEHLLNESITLIASLWFQHMLYQHEGSDNLWFDVKDYRILAELSLSVLIAKLGDHAQLKATFTGRYENFSRAVSASRYDLVVNGGLGVAF
jgi:hypothetical protein